MFTDRRDAGRKLAVRLAEWGGPDVVVLGLPRGGVVVAAEVAKALTAPLDVIVVRKLGTPGRPELAMGAVGEGGVVVLNLPVLAAAGVDDAALAAVQQAETANVRRRAALFRAGRQALSLRGKIAIVVDDGVATGSTAQAACEVARAMGAHELVLAVPVATPEVVRRLQGNADTVVCLQQPPWLHAVGQAYEDFDQVSDEEVVDLLRAAAQPQPAAKRGS